MQTKPSKFKSIKLPIAAGPEQFAFHTIQPSSEIRPAPDSGLKPLAPFANEPFDLPQELKTIRSYSSFVKIACREFRSCRELNCKKVSPSSRRRR